MKRNRVIILTLSLSSFFLFFSGIIRHDVDEKNYLSLANQKEFNCVGRIYKDSTSSGSCVLISDRFVLSAAHVFIDSDTRPDTIEFNGMKAVSYVTYNHRVTDVSKIYLMFNGQKVKVKKLLLHPNYLDSLTKGSCDIALLELEKTIHNITPAKVNTAFDELNSIVVGVGYGASGPANRPDLVSQQNKKIAGENVIDSIGGQIYLDRESLLICDFDHPTRNDCNKIGSPVPRPLEYICSGGDSGGGLFRNKNNAWELIGICSGSGVDINQLMKSGYYGHTMEWTRVSLFTNWLSLQTK
ncbi:MAG: trypsin-like serine protease [Saprospiraceae bacterium]|nr:trypsin-like serine protease [Candidatus Vicinibacter affinis]